MTFIKIKQATVKNWARQVERSCSETQTPSAAANQP